MLTRLYVAGIERAVRTGSCGLERNYTIKIIIWDWTYSVILVAKAAGNVSNLECILSIPDNPSN